MLYLALKYLLTAAIVVAVSELARRSTAFAAVLAALPLVSILAMVWLYVDTGDRERVASLSIGVFWMVLPTLGFFLLLPWLLRRCSGFWLPLLGAGAVMVVVYLVYALAGRRLGLPL
jgi:hypothetical protein